jgi:type II secretion system protein G
MASNIKLPISKTPRGFTIVELLIVIVVIGILAAITMVTYANIQQRGRDSGRLSDMKAIQTALENYKTINTTYPNPTSVNADWEESHEDNPGDFMEYLVSGGFINKVPIDPINNSAMRYRYYRYPAGYYDCDATKGAYYVIGIVDLESSGRPAASSPGWSCLSRNWSTEFDWVTGSYEK